MDQVDYYQNFGTKLIVTPKFRDYNGIFATFYKTGTQIPFISPRFGSCNF